MFYGLETTAVPQPIQRTDGPVIVGPTPAELRMKALDSVQHLRERGFAIEEMLAEADKVYVWLIGEKAK